LAQQIMTDVNAVHAAGFAHDGVTTGTPFFSGTDASDIAVDPMVVASPGLVAAAAGAGAAGDGSNALAIANLQQATNLGGGSESYDSFYSGIVSGLGAAVQNVRGLADAQTLSINNLQQ